MSTDGASIIWILSLYEKKDKSFMSRMRIKLTVTCSACSLLVLVFLTMSRLGIDKLMLLDK